MTDFAALEDRLGYRFKHPAFLSLALTHASAARRALESSERLEFLGDRVLGLAIAEILYQRFNAAREGELAKRLAALVRRETLAEIAMMLDLGDWIVLPKAAPAADRENATILADTLEAVIGAVYQDGGLAAAQMFIANHWQDRLNKDAAPQDAKSQLQEWALARGLALPDYTVIGCTGPDHAREFTIAVKVGEWSNETGRGNSKRLAEQSAAQHMLVTLGIIGQ